MPRSSGNIKFVGLEGAYQFIINADDATIKDLIYMLVATTMSFPLRLVSHHQKIFSNHSLQRVECA